MSLLTSCSAVTAAHAVAAAQSPTALKTLLARMVQIAKPGDGCEMILVVFGRLAEAEWVEGEVCVELTGDDVKTLVAIYCDHGFGIRERVLPTIAFRIPFEEFEHALMINPALILPMRAKERSGKLMLGRSVRSEENIASAIAIDDSSLHETERKTAPPQRSLDELEVVEDEEVVEAPEALEDQRPVPEKSGLHTHPTVRRMVAIRPEALPTGSIPRVSASAAGGDKSK